MGIGDWDTLHAGAGKGVWEKGPMKEPGGPARYPPEVQSTPLFQKCYRTGFNLHQHIAGLSGYHLLRIPRSLVCRQFSGRAVVDKNNEPKFGDYIVMLREREDLDDKRTGPEFRRRDMTYKTVQGMDGISDLVKTGKHSEYRDTEFLHVTMSQAALGNKKRGNVGGVASHYDYFNPKRYDGNAGPSKDAWVFNSGESMNPWLNSKADKKVRPFEKAKVEELMSWMMGMTTADAENHSIGEGAGGSKAKPSIVKIPTWKDTRGRKTLDLTRGMGDYYSDIIRCGECNGRTLVMLPSGNELEACDCPHCSSTGGLNTSHLVEGNPMQPITGMRAHR
jgi:hypothetical protein